MRSRTVSHQQLFIYVQLHDMHFEGVGIHIPAEWTEIVHDAFHLHRALDHAWRCNRFRRHRGEAGNAKFVRLKAIAPITSFIWHRIPGGRQCEKVNMGGQIFRGQIDNALASSDQIIGGLSHLP